MLILQRSSLSSNLILALLWLFIFLNSQSLISQNKINLEIKQYYPLDICGEESKQRVVLVIDSDPIRYEDSLYGFDFEISYNPEKLKFHTALTNGTLAGFFDYKDIVFSDSGSLRGFAVNISDDRVYGDKPLIAFWGDYLSKCPDTAHVDFKFFDFTDEFARKIDEKRNLILKVEIIDKPERYFKVKFDKDTLFFEGKERNYLDVFCNIMQNSYLDSLVVSINLDNEFFEIFSIENSSNKIKILDDIIIEGKRIVRLRIVEPLSDNDKILRLGIESKNEILNECILDIIPEQTDVCSCITRYNDDKIVLKNIEPSSIIDEKKDLLTVQYKKDERLIEIQSSDLLKDLKIYNLYGTRVFHNEIENKMFFQINTSLIPIGVYLIEIVISNGKRVLKKVCID